MFPNIDNKSGLKNVNDALFDNNFDLFSTWILIEICFTYNKSKFNHQHFLQTHGAAQASSYADSPIAKFDSLSNKFHLRLSVWKRFRDVLLLRERGAASLSLVLEYLDSIDKTDKVNFTMGIASNTGVEFLDLKLKIVEAKIRVDIVAKPTNNFHYTTPSTCYLKEKMRNIPLSIALRLKRICDDNVTLDKQSSEYQNYLTARDHKAPIVE